MNLFSAHDGEPADWTQAWPDALAFAGGLALAWFNAWSTKDLVWSLWLSSLLVGYAMIVWNIFAGPFRGPAYLGGAFFILAFFTVHFGGFHFVHSIFLNVFFPITAREGMVNAALYGQVLREYWPFVLMAFVAERQAFRWPAPEKKMDGNAVERANRQVTKKSADMMGPYKNVLRLHLLIFFFAFAHFAKLDNFLIYVVVSAVYFFPWRLVKKPAPVTERAETSFD